MLVQSLTPDGGLLWGCVAVGVDIVLSMPVMADYSIPVGNLLPGTIFFPKYLISL